MIIANHMAHRTDLDQVWLVVSPQNPLKPAASLANDYDRLHLVRLAIAENPRLRASPVEFSLPKPSYTIDTLTYLREKHPDHHFVLIMGGDNLITIHKWKNYEKLLELYSIYIYKRPHYDLGPLKDHPHIRLVEAPLLDISATFIRESIKKGFNIQYLVPEPVYNYLLGSSMYK